MTSPDPGLGLFAHAALCVALALGLFAAAALLRHRATRERPGKLDTYECGEAPFGPAWRQVHVGFYLVALVFIVFDALAVFLFPWVLAVRGLGAAGVVTMLIFLGIVALGWIYAYRERILEWQ